tara:strand:+ start:14956 stop:16254 length:1299 start_codon:yes stop_codon:yes gene_type:complete
MTLLTNAAPDQQQAFNLAQEGHHTLITGQAGTGKSWLIEQMIEHLEGVALTASTGIAGVNIGGRTIHSWAGVGMAKATADELIQTICGKHYHEETRDRIRACRTLIIDEISMLGATFMGKLDQVLRAVRNDETPFGGIQLLMFGDFLQLPPVQDQPFFTSPLWAYMMPKVIVLTTIHRQKDRAFAELLQRVRVCKHTIADCNTLRGLGANPVNGTPLVLHTHNEHVDLYNQKKLKSLDLDIVTLLAKDTGNDPKVIAMLDKNCLSPSKLDLCVGARVMCTKNITGALCNGTLGTVKEIIKTHINSKVIVTWDNIGDQTMIPAEWEITDTGTREVLARRTQFPLRLAWAITVHKSQGLTLDNVVAYLGGCFNPGMVYVALSRMSTMENLTLPEFDVSKIKADLKALAFYAEPNDPTGWGAKVTPMMELPGLDL